MQVEHYVYLSVTERCPDIHEVSYVLNLLN